jgi:LmbE family N-acetylglucosaminyl deacetylase
MPEPNMRVLLLSPHPDDIAWSLGATVARLRAADAELHVLTFFGRSRYAPGHAWHGHVAASRIRRAEELAWADRAGVTLRRLGLPDASLRGYDDETELGPTPAPELVDDVLQALDAACARVRPDLLLAPIAAGGHVDHAAVRAAVSRLRTDAEVLWFDDLPYAAAHHAHGSGHPVVVDVGELWPLKEAAVRSFASQRPDDVLPLLAAHGERIWASTAAVAERLAVYLSPSRSSHSSPSRRRTA